MSTEDKWKEVLKSRIAYWKDELEDVKDEREDVKSIREEDAEWILSEYESLIIDLGIKL